MQNLSKMVSVRMTPSDFAEIEELARLDKRTTSNMLRLIVEAGFEAQKKRLSAPGNKP